MTASAIHVVTGAFGYSGKYIARRLLHAGRTVRTLTNSPDRENPFGGRVQAFPYRFDKPEEMIPALQGADVLYNTYWVRFNYAGDTRFSHAEAVENTLRLFAAARAAGVRRIVHVSITNPSEDSPFEYFRGKARLERGLVESGMSYAILRPTVLFGEEDILINNIAWTLRHLPVFGTFGDGSYMLQPMYVDDLAQLAVEQGAGSENRIIDAIGPETFTYRGLVQVIGDLIGSPRPILPMAPWIAHLAGRLLGRLTADVTVTREEVGALMAGLLNTQSPPTGATRLTEWARANAGALGRHYHSELVRRRDRRTAYDRL